MTLVLRLVQAPLMVIYWTVVIHIHHTSCACTWPSVFQDSTWLDSSRGELTFTSSGMTGYTILGYSGAQVSSWTCQEDTFVTDGIVVARSTTTFTALGGDFYSYLCFKFTIITSVSYRYFLQYGQQPNSGQFRVYTTLDIGGTIAEACNPSAAASGSEFAMMIKKGEETSAYINCPSALLGRFEFNYTDSAGSEHCDDPDNTEHMNVCSDKTQLAFDVPCTTGQSIVYASDSVFCVASVTVGTDTFVQLYNNQTTVDSSTTYRFSCMAISSDSLRATIVYKNCTSHQTSTTVPRRHDQFVIGASISFSPYVFCQGGCTWPSSFVSSTWRDNTRGDITFGTDTLSGWRIIVQGSTVSNWECLDKTDFDTDGTLLLKATDTFTYVGGTWIIYICLSMSKVSDNSYYYYQKHDQDPTGGYERAKFYLFGNLTAKATICSNTSPVPVAEFHFMVRSGSESASRQFCPPSLLARMDYTHTSDAGVVTCDTSTDNWDVCSNRTTMTFDYSLCSTQMMYSASAEVYCMMNFTSTYDYTVVFNTDASPTYRFACIVSNSAGTAASVVYKNCTIGQTPTAYARNPSGTPIGYLLIMTPLETCPFLGPTTGSSTNDSGSLIPIIVGIVIGVLLLAIIAAVVIYCLKFKNRRGVKHLDEEKLKLPDDSPNGHIEKVSMEDLDNPALAAKPEKRNTLTPLSASSEVTVKSPRVLPPINHV